MEQAILLDTNVLSELMRPQPDAQVLSWFDLNTEAGYYTSAVILQVASNCGFLKIWNLRESSESNSDLWSVWVLPKHSVIAPLNVSKFE